MSRVTLLCILSTQNLVLLGRYPFLIEKAEFYLNPVTIDLPTISAFQGSPQPNKTDGEDGTLNRNTFKDICVDLSSFNTECRYKHCDTTEQYREIDGCCNNIGDPVKGWDNSIFNNLQFYHFII